MRSTRLLHGAAAVAAGLAIGAPVMVAGACASQKPATSTPGSGVTGAVTVFAAASLTEAFTQIGEEFEAANPSASVTFSFGPSSGLATQINEGAPADVFAAANPTTMQTVADAGNLDATPVVFARNQLVIAVAKGNPDGITSLNDLTDPGLKVALCAEPVPCGAAARAALAAATGPRPLVPVTLEQDVKAALAKVTLGEVDAALVYRTDVQAAGSDVDGVEFPESAAAINDYPIAVLSRAPHKTAAEAFVDYVLSGAGQAVLDRAGFQAR